MVKPASEFKNLPVHNAEFLNDLATKMEALHKHWTPTPAQKLILERIFKHNRKRIFIRAGRKFGKTELCMYIANRISILSPATVSLYVTPSLKQGKKILWKNRRLHNSIPPEFLPHFQEQETTVRFPNQSYTELDGSENYESHRGTEPDLLMLDELKDIDRRFYDASYPNLAPRNGLLIVIGTPPKERHNFYCELEEEAATNPDWDFFHFPTSSNPHISAEWLRKEKEAYYRRGEEDVWIREYEAQYVWSAKSQIIPNFRREKHVRHSSVLFPIIQHNRRGWEFYCTFDPATSTTFAALFIAYNRLTGQIFVLDEIYEKSRVKMTASAIWSETTRKINAISKGIGFTPKWFFIYDEAAAWFANEISTQFRQGMTASRKAKADKESGISLFNTCLSYDNCFYMTEYCRCFAFEVENYVTDDDGNYPNRNDHCIDGYRYFEDIAAVVPNPEGFTMSRIDPREARSQGLFTKKNEILSLEDAIELEDDFEYNEW